MDLLKIVINEVETALPNLNNKIFIDKLPTSNKGTGILFSEKSNLSVVPTFNDQPLEYQKRHISIYVYSETNKVKEAREDVYAIYEFFRNNPSISDRFIDGITPETPSFFGEDQNQKMIYITQVMLYYRS